MSPTRSASRLQNYGSSMFQDLNLTLIISRLRLQPRVVLSALVPSVLLRSLILLCNLLSFLPDLFYMVVKFCIDRLLTCF